MKALNDLCIKISLCNRMSLVSMLHHKDRSVPSSCQITSFASFLIFRYISLFFLIFRYFSLLVQLLRNLYLVYQKNDTQKKYIVPSYAVYETVSQMYPRRKIPGLSKNLSFLLVNYSVLYILTIWDTVSYAAYYGTSALPLFNHELLTSM